jgi:hypothetical protein
LLIGDLQKMVLPTLIYFFHVPVCGYGKGALSTNYGYDAGSYSDYPADETNKKNLYVLTGISTMQTN